VPYQAILDPIKNELSTRLERISQAEGSLETIEPVDGGGAPTIYIIRGSQNIDATFQKALSTTKRGVNMLLTQDFYGDRRFEKIAEAVRELKIQDQEVPVNIILSIDPRFQKYLQGLAHFGVDIYKWEFPSLIPFGLFITEDIVIFTIFDTFSSFLEYSLALVIEDFSTNYFNGVNYLFDWFKQNSKRVVFGKTKPGASEGSTND
jgi:hypothetical protein